MWLFLLNNVVVAVIVLTLSYAGFSKLIAYAVRKACKVNTRILSLSVVEDASIWFLWNVFKETWRPLILQSPSIKATVCVKPSPGTSADSSDAVLAASLASARKALLAWIDTRGHDTWFMSSMLFQVAFAVLTLMASCIVVAIPSITLSLVDETHELANIQVKDVSCSLKSIWKKGRIHMGISIKFCVHVSSGGQVMLHSDLHVQSSLQPVSEAHNIARLPPPFCLHALAIESSRFEIFPDAVFEAAATVDWSLFAAAPTPEQAQLTADLLVCVGYVAALVEPSFKVGCIAVARSRILEEVKVVGLHAVVKTHIQHRAADLLADHILNAVVPVDIGVFIKSVEIGARRFSAAEDALVSRWWKEFKLGSEVANDASVCVSSIDFITCFTWEVQLCSPNQPTLHLFRQRSYQQTSRTSNFTQIDHKVDVGEVALFCTTGQVHALRSLTLGHSFDAATWPTQANQSFNLAIHNLTAVVLCAADDDNGGRRVGPREYDIVLVVRADELSTALTSESQDMLLVRLDALRSCLGSQGAPAGYEWLNCSSASVSMNTRAPASVPVAVHVDQVRVGWCPMVVYLCVDLAAPFIQPCTVGQVFGAHMTKASDPHNMAGMDAIRAGNILDGLTMALSQRQVDLELSLDSVFASVPVAIENSFETASASEFVDWYQGLMMRYAGLNPLRHILWEEHTISAKDIRIRTFGTLWKHNDDEDSEHGWALTVRDTIVARHGSCFANTDSPRVLRVRPSEGQLILATSQFGMEQIGDIIDIAADTCRGFWNLSLQAWLWKNVMDITFTVWTALLRIRRFRHVNLLVDHYTVNAPLDDCTCLRDRYEEFLTLISYCADTKHRLYATDIVIEAEVVPESMKIALGDRNSLDPIKLTLAVQTFGGRDMPADWIIEGFSLSDSGRSFLDVEYVSFSHTTGIGSSILLGDRWRELKVRYHHAQRTGWTMPVDDHTRQLLQAEEEFRVVVRGVEGKLLQSDSVIRQFPAIGKAVQTLIHSTANLIPGRWTPDNENFKRLVRYAGFELYPQLRPQPANIPFSLVLEECVVRIEDNPLEAWLTTLQPIWMDERMHQLMREKMFAQQKDAVLKSATLAFAQEAIAILEQKLQEINSQRYIERVTQVLSRHRQAGSSRGFVSPAGGLATMLKMELQTLRLSVRPAIEEIRRDRISMHVKLMTTKLTTHVRGLHEPILCIGSVAMETTTTVNTLMSSEQSKVLQVPSMHLHLDHRLPAVEIPVAILPMTIYSDSTVSVEGVRCCYSPFVDFVLEDVFEAMSKTWSSTLSEIASPRLLQLPWWDIATGMLKLDAVVTVRDLEVFLLSARHELHNRAGDFLAPSPPDLPAMSELEEDHNMLENMPIQNAFVLLSIDKLSTVISEGGFMADVWSTKVHVRPTIVGLPALVDLPFTSARIDLKWLYGADSEQVDLQYSHVATDRTTALAAAIFSHLSANRPTLDIMALSADLSNLLRSSGIELCVSAKLSSVLGSEDVFLAEQELREQLQHHLWVVIPMAFYRRGSFTNFPESSTAEPEYTFSPGANVGAASIMCFGPCLRPLLFWLDGFRAISSLPFPHKGQNIIPRGMRAVRSHIRGLHLRPACFQQLDFFLYDRSPLDANSKGIRLAVKVGGEVMVSLQKEREIPHPFDTGKVLIQRTVTAGSCWCISHAHFAAQDIEARLCTEATGSRGEFLMAADTVKVDVSPNDATVEVAECFSAANDVASFDGSDSDPEMEPPQMGMHVETEPSDCLHSVLFDGLRIMITVDTRNALFDLLDAYYQLVLDALPLSFKAPTELLKSQRTEEENDKTMSDPNSTWFAEKPRDRAQSAPSEKSGSGSAAASRSLEQVPLSAESLEEFKDDLAVASRPSPAVDLRRRAVSDPEAMAVSSLDNGFADLPHIIQTVDDFVVYSPQQSSSQFQSREKAVGMLDAAEMVDGQLLVEDEATSDSRLHIPAGETASSKPAGRRERTSMSGKLKALRYLRRSNKACVTTNKRLPITSHKLATVAQRLAQDNIGLAAGANSRRQFLSAEELPEIFGLFSVRIHVAQVLIVDHTSRGSILAVLREAEVQGSVGRTIEELLLTPPEEDNIRLQQLAHRKLQEYIETVSVRVDGFYLFVAPTDVDFSVDALWLPKTAIVPETTRTSEDTTSTAGVSDIGATLLSHTASFRNQRSMYGVLKQVLEPAPISADVTILHTRIPQNSISGRLQDMKFTVNPAQLRIIRQVLTNIIASPLPSVEQRLADEQTLYLLQQLQPGPKKLFTREDLALAWENTRHLEWSLHNKQRLLDNMRGDNFEGFVRSSESTESGMAAIAGRDTTNNWLDSLHDDLDHLRRDRQQYWDAIRVISKEIRRLNQIKPDVQFSIHAGDLALQLVYEDLPFASLSLREVVAEGISFERGSGQFELHIMTVIVTAKQQSAEPSTATGFGASDQVLVVGSLFDHENIGKVVDRSTLGSSSGQSHIARMFMDSAQAGVNGEQGNSQRPSVVRVLADVGEPVGGLPLIRHCELNIAPLVVFLTRGLISKFVVYFTEAMADVVAEVPQTSTALRVTGFNRRQPRAPLPATHPEPRRSWRPSIFRRRSRASDPEIVSTTPSEGSTWGKAARHRQHRRGASKATEVDQMKHRARNTSIYRHMRIGEVNLLVTYRGDSFENLEDFEGMHLKIHSIVYSNKTWAPQEVLVRLRRDVVLDVLGQVSRNFQNIGVFLQQRLDLAAWSGLEGTDISRARQDDTTLSVAASDDLDHATPPSRSGTPPPPGRMETPPSERFAPLVAESLATADESGDTSSSTPDSPSHQSNREMLFGNLSKDKGAARKFAFKKGRK